MAIKRQFERVACRTEALISYRDTTFRGEVENLSLKGLFVKTDQKTEINETVGVTVFFTGGSGRLSFSLRGKVIHLADNGIGISFQKIDMDSLVHSTTFPDPCRETASDFCTIPDNDYLQLQAHFH